MKISPIRLTRSTTRGVAPLTLAFAFLVHLFASLASAQPPDHPPDHPLTSGTPKPIVGKPALAEDQMKLFLKANSAAEPLRMKVIQDTLIAPASNSSDPADSNSSPPSGINRDSSFKEIMDFTFAKIAEVDREACEQASIDYEEFTETLFRIAQVRQLIQMEREIASTRQKLARLDQIEAEDPDPSALLPEAQVRPLYDMDRNGLVSEISRYEREIETRKSNPSVNLPANNPRPTEKAVERAKKNRAKIDRYKSQIAQLTETETKHNAALADPRFAAQHSQITSDLKKLAEAKAKIQERLDRLNGSSASTKEPKKDSYLENLETRLSTAQTLLVDLDARWASGDYNREWTERMRDIDPNQREGYELRLKEYEAFLHDPPMRQAELDRQVVLRHRKRLVYMDESLLGDRRPVRLGPKGFMRGIAH